MSWEKENKDTEILLKSLTESSGSPNDATQVALFGSTNVPDPINQTPTGAVFYMSFLFFFYVYFVICKLVSTHIHFCFLL